MVPPKFSTMCNLWRKTTTLLWPLDGFGMTAGRPRYDRWVAPVWPLGGSGLTAGRPRYDRWAAPVWPLAGPGGWNAASTSCSSVHILLGYHMEGCSGRRSDTGRQRAFSAGAPCGGAAGDNQRVPTPPPFPLHVAKAGRNHLNEELSSLLPTGTGERYSQTISNLGHETLLRRCELPISRKVLN